MIYEKYSAIKTSTPKRVKAAIEYFGSGKVILVWYILFKFYLII